MTNYELWIRTRVKVSKIKEDIQIGQSYNMS